MIISMLNDATYSFLLLIFRVCQMKFVCINVTMFDLVHDVETVLHL